MPVLDCHVGRGVWTLRGSCAFKRDSDLSKFFEIILVRSLTDLLDPLVVSSTGKHVAENIQKIQIMNH